MPTRYTRLRISSRGTRETRSASNASTRPSVIGRERRQNQPVVGADHLGHSHVSMTQDWYMTRGRIHTQVADLLDRTVRINDEKR